MSFLDLGLASAGVRVEGPLDFKEVSDESCLGPLPTTLDQNVPASRGTVPASRGVKRRRAMFADVLPQAGDSYHWLKYGEKLLRDRKTLRHYFRCGSRVEAGCKAKKMVDVVVTTGACTWHYRDSHNHPVPVPLPHLAAKQNPSARLMPSTPRQNSPKPCSTEHAATASAARYALHKSEERSLHGTPERAASPSILSRLDAAATPVSGCFSHTPSPARFADLSPSRRTSPQAHRAQISARLAACLSLFSAPDSPQGSALSGSPSLLPVPLPAATPGRLNTKATGPSPLGRPMAENQRSPCQPGLEHLLLLHRVAAAAAVVAAAADTDASAEPIVHAVEPEVSPLEINLKDCQPQAWGEGQHQVGPRVHHHDQWTQFWPVTKHQHSSPGLGLELEDSLKVHASQSRKRTLDSTLVAASPTVNLSGSMSDEESEGSCADNKEVEIKPCKQSLGFEGCCKGKCSWLSLSVQGRTCLCSK